MNDMNEETIREVTNPSDKITVDYTDRDAARVAVLIVGRGKYGISGDNGMPVFLLGGSEEWSQEEYGKSLSDFVDSISDERVITALESFKNVRERSSMNDIVGLAKEYAQEMRKRA